MNEESTIIAKRATGYSELFNADKLQASIYASCLSVHAPTGWAKMVAEHVCHDIAGWLAKKPEVTSADIRRKAAGHLQKYHADAAFIYKNHRTML